MENPKRPHPSRAATRFSLIAALLLLLVSQPRVGQSPWEHLSTKNGIELYRSTKSDSNFLRFKAVGVVRAQWYVVLATIADLEKAAEWVDSLEEIRVLKKVSRRERIFYGRFGAPWPLNDRDVVLQGQLDMDPKTGAVRLSSRSIDYGPMPPRDGIVRMPLVNNQWRLTPINGGQSTLVEFRAQADPGGVIPSWAANMVSKRIPYNSLINLRRQIIKGNVSPSMLKEIHAQLKMHKMETAMKNLEETHGHLL